MEILIKRLSEDVDLPVYDREVGPGFDLLSAEAVTVNGGERVLVSTGIAVAMSVGYIGLVCNESDVSGNSTRITAMVIDSGYRKEIKIELTNVGTESVVIGKGVKVAQILVQQINHPHLIEAEDLGGENAIR